MVGVPDDLLHNCAGGQAVTVERVQAACYFSFPLAVTRHDHKELAEFWDAVSAGLQLDCTAFSSFLVPESMQKES